MTVELQYIVSCAWFNIDCCNERTTLIVSSWSIVVNTLQQFSDKINIYSIKYLYSVSSAPQLSAPRHAAPVLIILSRRVWRQCWK